MHVPSYVLWLVEFRCSASALSGSVRLCTPLKLQAAKAPVKLIKNVGSDGGSNGSSDVIVTRVEVCFPTAVQETMSVAVEGKRE